MFVAAAHYGILEGGALWLAGAALNPSIIVASVTTIGSYSTGGTWIKGVIAGG